jgi:PIN domain nuclease of toxin-antitoxin system
VTSAVLDASAVLAFVKDEPGAEKVLPYIGDAAISAVNVQEVAKDLLGDGLTLDAIRAIVDELRLDVRPHGTEDAYAAAALVEQTAQYGRGLGDRSCMALGLAMGTPVVTADREWRKVTVDGLRIQIIR